MPPVILRLVVERRGACYLELMDFLFLLVCFILIHDSLGYVFKSQPYLLNSKVLRNMRFPNAEICKPLNGESRDVSCYGMCVLQADLVIMCARKMQIFSCQDRTGLELITAGGII
jgi:hypothetical protein